MGAERILITGGAGFIGAHVANELLAQGYTVRALDSLVPQVHGPDRKRPAYIPDNFDPTRYSAVYHTDVLVPTAVTTDARLINNSYAEVDAEVWKYLILDYITASEFPADHVNYGLFHGHPVEDCGKYHNPWPPRVAYNRELFEY